jgi:hypothetical protein
MSNVTQLGDQIRARVQASLAGRHSATGPAARPVGADPDAIRALVQERLRAASDHFTTSRPGTPSGLSLPALPPRTVGPSPLPASPGPVPAPAAAPTATPAQAASGDTSTLLGAMTADDIERVLAARGSKLAGQGYGAYILAMEQKYGVPAAQFLAQAVKESQIGSDNGYAQPGFNIGNIRPGTSWNGPVVDGPYGQFRVYGSWEEGIEDYFKLLASPIYAGKTLKDQIYTYAPPSENDTNRYYTDVVALIGEWTGIQL